MKKTILVFAALLLAGCGNVTEVGAERGKQVFRTCAPCHGVDGGGMEATGAPSIAGQEQWYIESQLVKFRDGARGDHPDDVEGLRMRPMARSLRTHAGDVESVAEYVSSMPLQAPDHTLGGDAAAGAARFALCVACHGPDGKGNQAMNAPSLTDKDDWYLARQIEKFKSGIRGADPLDASGATMVPMAMTLPDDKAVADVLAHIATLK
ncbi:MAG: cytochrome c [Proteobacteria bacterium]|nr:cytochrome c [Pseudomonadota bacterium]